MLPPEILLEQLPLSREGATTVNRGRGEVADVLSGRDDRLVVVVGPCSVHDPEAALEYAGRLKELEAELAGTYSWSCACTSRSPGPRLGGRV
jgi:3-deoxy-7-phosphoheptulonate synthase